MNPDLGTQEKLLNIISDMEILSKELIDNLLNKHQKTTPGEHAHLVKLLMVKDEQFCALMSIAAQQAETEKEITELKAKVDIQDQEIKKLHRTLTELEQSLAAALYQARLKLNSIEQANKRPVQAEELIKYAHRISTANAVTAPLTWCIGDLRRPYPTDVEMRNGFLGKSDLNINGSTPSNLNSSQIDAQRNINETPSSFQNQYNWNIGDLHIPMGSSGATAPLDPRSHKETSQDEAEVMSTDSSSSSSSDSQ